MFSPEPHSEKNMQGRPLILQFRKIPASLICGTKAFGAAALLFCWLAAPATAASCSATGEIISNDMRLIAGSGDTLWIASSSTQGWGVNYTLNRGGTWWGYYLGCHNAWVTDIAFAKGLDRGDQECSLQIPRP